jgi:hypothetical protein
MSWQLVRHVFENSRAKPIARLVLLNLAERVNESGGIAWPSRETIARECGLSIRGTHQLLRYLRQIGEIDFTDGKNGGRGRSNRYSIILRKREPDARFSSQETGNVKGENPAHRAPEPKEPARVLNKKHHTPKSIGRQKAARSDFGW